MAGLLVVALIYSSIFIFAIIAEDSIPPWTVYSPSGVYCGGAWLKGDLLLNAQSNEAVKDVYAVNCFNDPNHDDLAILTVISKPEKTNRAYPAKLSSKKTANLHGKSGVTGGYYEGKHHNSAIGLTGRITESQNCPSLNGMFPNEAAFCATINQPMPNMRGFNVSPGMPFADNNGKLLGIRIDGEENIYMRVDHCLDKIQQAMNIANAGK